VWYVSATSLTPKLEIRKTIPGETDNFSPGDTFTYRIEYRNTVIGSTAVNAVITDELDLRTYTVVSPSDLAVSATGFLEYPVGDLVGSAQYQTLDIEVRLKDPLPSETETCNIARLNADNASLVQSSEACATVTIPCIFDPTNNPNCIEPDVVCVMNNTALQLTTRTATFEVIADAEYAENVQIVRYEYDFGDGNTRSIDSSEFTNIVTHAYEPGAYKASAVIFYTITGDPEERQTSDSCGSEISFEADKPFSQLKTVKNITKNLEDEEAVDSKVEGGDILEYTLVTGNSQEYERTGIVVEDYIGDVLNYATLDLEKLESDGGQYDEETKKVIWEDISIPANGKVEKSFSVTIIDPVPSTNKPSQAGGDYDCVITNTYGNATSLDVDCPLIKTLESLPNTGPGASMITITGVTTVMGYFFARSSLLKKELQIIRTDYATTGGM
jgi:hypothetical protein